MNIENSNQKIDFQNIDKTITKKSEFPAQINDEYRVFFKEEAYNKMMAHANLTTEVELGGILLGEVCQDARGFFLVVSAVIEGKHTNNYGTQLTFTHETWQHINEEKDSKYPDERIIGWYHTHPGFGIFLSDMDSFIQDNFFNMPYQVAVVIETKEHQEGCFYWKDGHTEPLKRYWVGPEEKCLMPGGVEPFEIENHSRAREKVYIQSNGSSASEGSFWDSPLFAVLIIIVFVAMGYFWGKFASIMETKRMAYEAIQSELYSILEYASLNFGAETDLASIEKRVEMAEEILKEGKTEDAQQDLADIRQAINTIKKNYQKKPLAFRDNLKTLEKTKQNLGARVNECIDAQQELKAFIAQMYIIRAEEIFTENGARKKVLSQNDTNIAYTYLMQAMVIDPACKVIIQAKFPEFVNMLRQQQAPRQPTSGDLPQSNTSPTPGTSENEN